LLTVAVLGDPAFGVTIKEAIEERAKRDISIGALHSTIARLEEKGYLKSHLGGATQERGGRRKRYFQLTHGGKSALHDIKNLRDDLWKESKASLALGIRH
jgi:PadR family transcriptional regulator PadR